MNKKNPSVQEMAEKYLKENGYDGLYCEDCGCLVDDLAPCGEMMADCTAGYKHPAPKGEGDYWIKPEKLK